MIGAALLSGHLDHNCRVCKRNPEIREAWGCDNATTLPQFYIPCVRCRGEDPKCELCKDDGRGVPVFRCPMGPGVLPRPVARCLALYQDWESGKGPHGNALEDHPAAFVDAMRLLRSELGRLRQERMEEERARNAAKR